MRPAVALCAILVLGAFAAAIPVQAAVAPGITLLSEEPLAGDYTMSIRVTDFTLEPNFNKTGEGIGHIIYGLNGAPCWKVCAKGTMGVPCSGTCSDGRPYETTSTTFVFHDVKAGDVIVAILVRGNGSDLSPPVYLERTVKNILQPNSGARLAIDGTPPHPGTPNPGTYTMSVTPIEVTLIPAGGKEPNDRSHGHLRYLLNGQVCKDACSADADANATIETSFTFHELKVGDIVGVELLNNDGTPFYPVVRALQVVAAPAIQILTAGPRADSYTMTVRVTGFTLTPPQNPVAANNAGIGHIHYLVKHKGESAFTPASGTYATASTSFVFHDISEGDMVAAELVNNDHSSLATKVVQSQTVLAGEPQDPLAPGVGPILMFVLLGAAFVARRQMR